MRLSISPGRLSQDYHVEVRLGEFDISVASDSRAVVDDVRALYAGAPAVGTRGARELEVEVCTTKRALFRSRRYGVFCNGEPLRTTLPAAEVLPHVEWGLNYQMITKCRHLLQLHAASLSYRGVGVVFAAPSGSGKSTLAAALLARGWRYLCDEFALIDPTTPTTPTTPTAPTTLSLCPFPKAVCLKAGSFSFAEELGLPLAMGRRYIKGIKGEVGYINPFALGADTIGTRCPLQFVVFPRYDEHQEPRIWAMSAGKASFNLARCALNRYDFDSSGVDLFSRIASTTTTLGLRAGGLEATCELLERTIEEAIENA